MTTRLGWLYHTLQARQAIQRYTGRQSLHQSTIRVMHQTVGGRECVTTGRQRYNSPHQSTVRAMHQAAGDRECSPGESMTLDVKGHKLELHYHWLRHHCNCDSCYDSVVCQKYILPHHISPDIHPVETTTDEATLNVVWSDGHASKYSLDWLLDKQHINARLPGEKLRKLWNHDTLKKEDIQFVNYDKYMSSDDGLKDLIWNLHTYGFAVVDGLPADIPHTQQVGLLFHDVLLFFFSYC